MLHIDPSGPASRLRLGLASAQVTEPVIVLCHGIVDSNNCVPFIVLASPTVTLNSREKG
jgi:hypothetical protein